MSRFAIVLRGCAAGLAGAAAMHAYRLAWEWFTFKDKADAIFGFDEEADTNAVQLTSAALTGRVLSQDVVRPMGLAMHYAFGAALGALYGTYGVRGHVGLEATALWLAADEIPVALCGLSKPLDRRAASHASALGTHLIFIATVQTMLSKGAVGAQKE